MVLHIQLIVVYTFFSFIEEILDIYSKTIAALLNHSVS